MKGFTFSVREKTQWQLKEGESLIEHSKTLFLEINLKYFKNRKKKFLVLKIRTWTFQYLKFKKIIQSNSMIWYRKSLLFNFKKIVIWNYLRIMSFIPKLNPQCLQENRICKIRKFKLARKIIQKNWSFTWVNLTSIIQPMALLN
jgi:hypothetical protein